MPASKRQSCNYKLWMVNMENYSCRVFENFSEFMESNGVNVEIDADPNLADYIDLESFGNDLLRYGDTTISIKLPNGKVVLCEDGL